MRGNPNAVVVDVWLTRAFEVDKVHQRKQPDGSFRLRSGGPTGKIFKLIEHEVVRIAQGLQLEPRQTSAMIWSGIRKTVGRNHNTRYHEILRHKLFNMYENN